MTDPISGSEIVPTLQIKHYRKLLGKYLGDQLSAVFWMTGLLLMAIVVQLANPQVIRYFLDTAQSGGPTRTLLLAASLFLAFALVQQVLTLAATYASQRVSWTATNQMRLDLAQHCLRLDMSFHKQHTPGELIERIDGDISQLSNFFSQFVIKVAGNALLVLGILALLFRENLYLGSSMVAYTAVTLVALGFIQRLAAPRWRAARQISAAQFGYLEERISGVEDIRAVGGEAYVLQRLYDLMRQYLERLRLAFVVGSLTYHMTDLVYILGYTIGLAMGVILYLRGDVTIGTAYLIVFYVGMLETPLQAIREQAEDLQQATASLQRIQSLFDQQPLVHDPPLPRLLATGALSLSFKGVSFHYENDDKVLEDISFDLPKGRLLGVLGRTGSGKSTLARLLFRLYDPSEGAILLDGNDLRAISIKNLRQRVGMVTQDVQLFRASVRDNLTFFNPAISDEQLERVLSSLRLWSWVQSLPDGLDTRLAAGGGGLSAGEAQLLAFARVFLKEPGLIILDEASSRLDPPTETLMEQAIDRLFQGRTGVIIAHRLRTVQRADDILILEDGRLVEFGDRERLAADRQSRFYRLLQTGLEEALA